MKDISLEVGNSSLVPSLDFENCKDEECTFKFRTSRSVMIKNVPSIIKLLQLKEAMSVFGKVSKASKRSVPNGLDCCDIEVKKCGIKKHCTINWQYNIKELQSPNFLAALVRN